MTILHIDPAPLRSAFLAAQRQADRMTSAPDRWDDPAALAGPRAERRRKSRRRLAVAGLLLVAMVATAAYRVVSSTDRAGDAAAPVAANAALVPTAMATAEPPRAAPDASPHLGAATSAASPVEPVRDAIALVRGRVEFDLRGADARQVLPRLAALTGASLSGLDALAGDSRITLQGSRRAGLESWKAVLEGINSILSCSPRACEIWILPGPREGAGIAFAPAAAPAPTASSEGDESVLPATSPPPAMAPGRTTPRVPSSEETEGN